jgi:hypothetical protein
MAKKRKKGKPEPEEYEFRPPDFDEKEFLKKELRDTRTALVTITYAIVFGIIAGMISMMGTNLMAVAFLAGIAGIVTLGTFYKLAKVDTSGMKRRNWVGNIGTFFFTFLAIWVLMLNMPFADHARPTVDQVIVWVNDGTHVYGKEYKLNAASGAYEWTAVNASHDPVIRANSSYRINITARVSDNGNLKSVEIAVGSVASGYNPMISEGKSRYGYQVTGDTLSATSDLMFFISARDAADNSILFNPATPLAVEP